MGMGTQPSSGPWRRGLVIVVAASALAATGAAAGEADVVAATTTRAADGTWRFEVTVRHADDGWDHYADLWEVVAPDGAVLGARTLLHPHDVEQPFTRDLAGVAIADGVVEVEIRARDSVHGYGGKVVRVSLGD